MLQVQSILLNPKLVVHHKNMLPLPNKSKLLKLQITQHWLQIQYLQLKVLQHF